ncbi:MAG TPA: DUF58 domain-containing protein [Elusimicrobia bacterium]|nr:DUF58 domain-containing protein [Elusimicrobiota bacterium]
MEFSEVREYQSGDDIKTIDWNVSARYGNLFVKKFIEERELTIILLIDISGSQKFGSQKSKIDLAAELSGVISFSALKNNDRIGVILFSDKIEKFIPPKKGKKHCLRIISEVLSTKAEYGTDIYLSLDYLNRVIKKRSIVFLISDFFDTDYEKLLKITSKKHDLILVNINDPLETKIPDSGIFHFVDAERAKDIYVDGRDYIFAERFAKSERDNFKHLEKTAKNMGIDMMNFYTDKPYILPLINFFKSREKKFR